MYSSSLDNALALVNIPSLLFSNEVASDVCHSLIDDYYNDVMSCIVGCSTDSVPVRKCGSFQEEHVIPGWNEHVADKHRMAREAFMLWVSVGKPRHGPEFHYMQRTRARFKCALRYCQRYELQINADKMAERLMDKDYKGFWDTLRKSSNDKATCHSTAIGGCSGVANIVNMWKDHFEKLYNSVNVSEARDKFMTQMSNAVNQEYSLLYMLVMSLMPSLNKRKVRQLALTECTWRLLYMAVTGYSYTSVYFLTGSSNTVTYQKKFMLSVIVPLVKCKTKDLSDVDNYRAICLSSTISKLFESVIAKEVNYNRLCW